MPVHSVTADSITAAEMPATRMSLSVKIANALHPITSANRPRYRRRHTRPRANWSAASSRNSTVSPVAAWCANSQTSSRRTRYTEMNTEPRGVDAPGRRPAREVRPVRLTPETEVDQREQGGEQRLESERAELDGGNVHGTHVTSKTIAPRTPRRTRATPPRGSRRSRPRPALALGQRAVAATVGRAEQDRGRALALEVRAPAARDRRGRADPAGKR